MRKSLIIMSLVVLFGCTSGEGGGQSAGDTVSTAIPQPDSNYVITDTDDHNLPSPENVPLDAPPRGAPADSLR